MSNIIDMTIVISDEKTRLKEFSCDKNPDCAKIMMRSHEPEDLGKYFAGNNGRIRCPGKCFCAMSLDGSMTSPYKENGNLNKRQDMKFRIY